MFAWFKNLGLKVKCLTVLAVVGVAGCIAYSWFLYNSAVNQTLEQARVDAGHMLGTINRDVHGLDQEVP